MFDTAKMDERLRRKLSRGELAALTFVFLIAFYFLFSDSGNFWDYTVYLAASNGDYANYYYGYWLLPIFKLLSLLPFEVSYTIWIVLGILGVWFAARVFNGNSILALCAYQLSYALFWGQITGIVCGVFALFWWSINHRKWVIGGLALLVAGAKPQSGGLIVFFLWLLAEIPWKDKFRVLIVPILGVAASLILYPGWIGDVFARKSNLYTVGNITLFQWIGLWSWLLLIPAAIIPMPRQKRFFSLVTASILALPYFLQTDLLSLFVFPVGFIPVLLGYIPAILLQIVSFQGQPSGVIVPLFIYCWTIFPEFVNWINQKMKRVNSQIRNF